MRRISGVDVFVANQLEVLLFEAREGLLVGGAVGGGFALMLVEAADGLDQFVGFVGAAVALEGLTQLLDGSADGGNSSTARPGLPRPPGDEGRRAT
jgi:hypothetical protein